VQERHAHGITGDLRLRRPGFYGNALPLVTAQTGSE
jgi:hypothetical protein